MPLYEYRCENCGEAFEQIARFSQADLNPPCPECGHANTTKMISAAASFGMTGSGSSSACAPGGRFT